ncbi:MAG TPA: class I SAM-dependent RNA methyltransferase, partial [Phototrophicaceae bacterium]|nr:class I SAM-dependent RNA methyltransferase [Phototrophicaceae bacterium]
MTDTFELELTTMAHGGSAIGRHDGRAIFVPYGIPGEKILARITQDKGRFAEAEVVEVLDSAPIRVTPRCPHFGICGGCHWQHIDYAAQLDFKRQVVQDQMRRMGGFTDLEVLPTIGSPQEWAYRVHITLHQTDKGQPGFVATDDRTVIPVNECDIIHPKLLDMLHELNNGQPVTDDQLRLQTGTGETPDTLEKVYYTVSGRRFQCTVGSFFQVNIAQAETLVRLMLEALTPFDAKMRVLDLYAGVGLFTAFLAERASQGQVTMIESAGTSIQDARVNLADFKNIRFIEGLAEQALPNLKTRFDAAVIDPPRTGMKPKALEALVKCQPRTIVYVSCDPATLARDAKLLAAKGYRLNKVQPVDMFP